MSQHLHPAHVDGCYRCELSRDEFDDEAIVDNINELVDELVARRSALTYARLRHGYALVREEAR